MKKVAIVNRTNFLNFGSVLQVYALVEAVKKLGYISEVIWEKGSISKYLDLRPNKVFSIIRSLIRHPQFIIETYKDLKSAKPILFTDETKTLFKNFVKNNIETKFFSSKEFSRVGKSDEYHRFICGSDQIWSSTTLYPDPLMYLRFAEKNKRVAYAPSFGRDYIPSYNKRKLRKYIKDIPFLSIREQDGVNLIKDLVGVEVPLIIDPTLLFDKSFWNKKKSNISKTGFILCYFLTEPDQNVQKEILKFAKNKDIVILRSHLSFIEKEADKKCIYPDAGPNEFLAYIDNADFVFTDSYHGMLFSINYEKEFLSVERNYGKYDQSTRQKSILTLLQISDHYNSTGIVSTNPIDYHKVNEILFAQRSIAFDYLKNALR